MLSETKRQVLKFKAVASGWLIYLSCVIHFCLLHIFVFDTDGQQARKRNQSCMYVLQHSILGTGVCSCTS